MNLLNQKIKGKIPTFVVVILFIIIISAIIFISKALYNDNGVEISAETKSNLNIIKYVNYEKDGKESSIVELNLKEGITYNNDYYSPVKDNSAYLKIPTIGNQLPSKVEVISISSKATNGNDLQKEAQYEYNNQNGILHIFANNEMNENGDFYYGKSSDYDEYDITLYYENKIDIVNTEENVINVPLVIQYNSLNEEIGLIQGKYSKQITLEEKGNLISSEIKTEDIYSYNSQPNNKIDDVIKV